MRSGEKWSADSDADTYSDMVDGKEALAAMGELLKIV